MKAIAILNLKGGVGKTVTAVNMASILASDYKKKVLLCDCDSQCNTTEFFGIDPDADGAHMSQILLGDAEPYYPENIWHTNIAGLDLLPADDGLMELDISSVGSRVDGNILSDMVQCIWEDHAYDYVIFDCPPAFNAASMAALVAAEEVVIPIKLDAFSICGMANLTRQISNMRRINPALTIAGCLVTMWYRDEDIAKAERTLRNYDAQLPVFETVIRQTPKVDKMTFQQEPLIYYSPRSAAGLDYRFFVAEFLKREEKDNV